MERKEGAPVFQISCDTHGNVGIAHDLNDAFQVSTEHLYKHPECDDYMDASGRVQKHVHIADTIGNVWR